MKFNISLLFIFITTSIFCQKYTASDVGSSIKFTIKNLGLNVDGTLSGLSGKVNFSPNDLTNSSFDVSLKSATINTDNGTRDKHLKKAEYFDVEKYPTISFVSSKIQKNKAGAYVVDGTVTIKGVSKKIEFPFKITDTKEGLLLSGEFKLNRRDFKVGGSSMVMSDNLTAKITVLAKK